MGGVLTKWIQCNNSHDPWIFQVAIFRWNAWRAQNLIKAPNIPLHRHMMFAMLGVLLSTGELAFSRSGTSSCFNSGFRSAEERQEQNQAGLYRRAGSW